MDFILDRAFFESRIEQTFQVGEGPIEVKLVECNRLKSHPGGLREPFALLFRGALNPFLSQRTYPLQNDGTAPIEIFLVPVARDADGILYEAVFN